MPDPNVDHPRFVALRARTARLRAELDRADAEAADYDGPGRERFISALLSLREALDELDARIDAEAAGL